MEPAAEEPRLRLGTSGWSYDHWWGALYPPELSPIDWLARYAEEFDTVELNSSFYRLPFVNMVKGWAKRSPEGFTFAAKAHRRITHLLRLRDCRDEFRRCLSRLQLLGGKLGPLLFQFPPNLGRDEELLEQFVAELPSGDHAIEFRHASWETPDVFALLSHYGVAHCVVSMPNYPVDLTTTGRFAYVRLHGSEKLYASCYSDQELAEWAARLLALKQSGLSAYVYFNNDANGHAVRNARTLKALVEA